MVTKIDAYQVALGELNTIWVRVSASADSWAKSPAQALNMVTVPIQAAINSAIENINGVADTLTEETAKNILKGITVKLGTFKGVLTAEAGGVIANAAELINAWKITLQKMLTDISESSPEAVKIPTFIRLQSRLSA